MKKLKKLIPALCMLLVSAVLLGTTTYAWFSMNTSVRANNLGVTAKSNATYLLIGKEDNKTDKSKSSERVDEEASNKSVYPVAYYATTTADTTIGSVKLSQFSGYTVGTWVGNNKWFTANNGKSDNATNDVKNAKLVEEGTADYMVTYTYYITLSADSEDFKGNLNIAMLSRAKIGAEVADYSNAVNAVVKVEAPTEKDGEATPTYVNLTEVKAAGEGSDVAIYLTKETSVKVTIYVYVDGNNENVKSANTANGISGKLSFGFGLGNNTL